MKGIVANPTRGRRVILVFAMQGVGVFLNALTLTLLLAVTGQFGNYSAYDADAANDNGQGDDFMQEGIAAAGVSGYYDRDALLGIWRVIYAIGAATLAYVLVSRIKFLEESDVWAEDQKTKRTEELELVALANQGTSAGAGGGQQQQQHVGELKKDGFVPPRPVPEQTKTIRGAL